MSVAQFKFYGTLTDFLPAKNRDRRIDYLFSGRPAIRDAVEAIGVPHVEIKEIVLNGKPVSWDQHLADGNLVEVYPFIAIAPAACKFILDVHLGKLARLLRLLGFDSAYENDFTDPLIAGIAIREDRIVLTRDIGLLKFKSIHSGYWLRSQDPFTQLKEVRERFGLSGIRPFTRCLVCNGCIESIEKETVIQELPADTILHFHEFYQCRSCKKIYWKGSHYDRMMRFISTVFQ